jgi:hypothetical protein
MAEVEALGAALADDEPEGTGKAEDDPERPGVGGAWLEAVAASAAAEFLNGTPTIPADAMARHAKASLRFRPPWVLPVLFTRRSMPCLERERTLDVSVLAACLPEGLVKA